MGESFVDCWILVSIAHQGRGEFLCEGFSTLVYHRLVHGFTHPENQKHVESMSRLQAASRVNAGLSSCGIPWSHNRDLCAHACSHQQTVPADMSPLSTWVELLASSCGQVWIGYVGFLIPRACIGQVRSSPYLVLLTHRTQPCDSKVNS